MNKDKVISILKRIGVEFAVPAAIGFVWMLFEVGRNGEITAYVKQFGVTFFIASWVWGQLLRIIYQEGQREGLKVLGEKLADATDTIEKLRTGLDAMAQAAAPTSSDMTRIRALALKAESDLERATSGFSSYAWERRPATPRMS